MNHRGRIVMIGAVTHYTSEGPPIAPNNLFELSSKEITAQGLMTHFRHDQYDVVRQQLENWLSNGKLKCFEHKLKGIENVGEAFCQMFDGKNFGKTVVDL